ncbi:MAG: hypothetical protein ACM3U2_06400 [Deltaproteobacteria bacterium]
MLTRRCLALGLMAALLWLPLGAIVLAAPAESAAPESKAPPAAEPGREGAPAAAPDKAAVGAAREESLATTQDVINRRYKRFEDTLYKIAESLRKTDPDRADLLLRAIGRSKEDRIAQQMNELAQLLKENKQLGDAIDRQGEVVTQLHALLDLLLSEDRQKELKEEKARIEKYIREVNNIIAKEKANRADTERGAPADEVAGQQKKIAGQTENLGKQMAKDDAAKQAKAKPSGKSADGKPSEGKSADGKSDDGKSDDKNPAEGKPPEGKPTEGKPSEGKPSEGKPSEGKPSEGKPSEGKPSEGKPSEGKPSEGKPSEGKPSEGKPSEGKPSEGKPSEGKPSEGQPSEGQPSEGQPSEGQPSQSPPQQTPGREELEKARRDMERAIENLKKKQRHEASDAQDDALANLQKAKEKLEEILRQLREEERDRFLAMLEARFQRMLAMQLIVNDGTVKLDKTPEADRSSRHSARSLQLARQEEEIAIEATKAITLLREEGSAIAFPEAVEQMRDDMRIVVTRLERTDVAELTQAIEREIVLALEEMIDALQKEMEKNKDKKKDQPPPKDGQPQEPPLVDQLAELKMLRTLQLRINHRTKRLGRMVEGEQAQDLDVVSQLQNLADRQARIQKATYDMATGRNK